MKNNTKYYILILIPFFVTIAIIIITAIMQVYPAFNLWMCRDHGSVADWLQGVGTIGALLFAYQEIINSKEQFNQEHKPKLRVYVTWNKPLKSGKKRTTAKYKSEDISVIPRPVAKLHIVPVNVGLSSGIYRYFGICKKDNLPQIRKLMKKASDGQLGEQGLKEIADMIYYNDEDIGDTEDTPYLKVMDLVYPKNKEIFQSIKPNNVGKIIDKPIAKIQGNLHIKVGKDAIEVLFTDPQMKIYNFEFKPFKKI